MLLLYAAPLELSGVVNGPLKSESLSKIELPVVLEILSYFLRCLKVSYFFVVFAVSESQVLPRSLYCIESLSQIIHCFQKGLRLSKILKMPSQRL